MRRISTRRVTAIVVMCGAVGAGFARGEDAVDVPGVRVVPLKDAAALGRPDRSGQAALRQALVRRVDFEFVDVPLSEAMEFLRQESGAKSIVVDVAGLEADGIDPKLKVTFQASRVTLGQALHRILSPFELDWIARDESLIVTTKNIAADRFTTRVLPQGRLSDAVNADVRRRLLPPEQAFGQEVPARNPLVTTIESAVPGPWQNVEGSGGVFELSGGILTVRGTVRQHDEMAGLLAAIQMSAEGKLNHGAAEIHPTWSPAEDQAKLDAALTKRGLDFQFDETPLKEAMQFLSDKAGVRILVDEKSLKAEGVDSNSPVNRQASGVTLKSGLESVLQPMSLKAVSDHGFLIVVTDSTAATMLRTVVYDVRDLDSEFTPEALLKLLRESTGGLWVERDGEGGVATIPLRGCVVVRQSERTQHEVAQLLEELREAKAADEKELAAEDPQRAKPDPAAMETRFYPILRKGTAAQISAALADFVSPTSWKGQGGTGVAQVVDETLVIRQSLSVHQEIKEFLQRLRTAENGPKP